MSLSHPAGAHERGMENCGESRAANLRAKRMLATIGDSFVTRDIQFSY